MVPGIDQNRGLVTLPDSSRLELMVLEPDLPEKDVAAFVQMHNERWRFHTINEDTFRRRIERGILVGGYLGNEPATLLETTSLNLEGVAEIEKTTEDYRERAYGVAKLLHGHAKDYNGLTNNGEWHKDDENPNVSVSATITYYKAIMLKQFGFQRPINLRDVEYAFPFSPKPSDYTGIDYKGGSLGLHIANGAFNTGYSLPQARHGHPEPDAIFMCYLAPGYVPKLGNMTIHRVCSGMPITR